jgi:hypothetical protein
VRVGTLFTAAVVLGVAMAGPVWASSDHAEHDMAWYVNHPEAREKQLFACLSTPALNGSAECHNTISAASKVLGGETDGFWANKDPAFYRANGMQRGLVLAACKTNRPPPASWCDAARAASASNEK